MSKPLTGKEAKALLEKNKPMMNFSAVFHVFLGFIVSMLIYTVLLLGLLSAIKFFVGTLI